MTTLFGADARDSALDALEKSRRTLPSDVQLNRKHPSFPESQLALGKFEPAYDDNTTIDGPHRFSAAYWVLGCTGRDALSVLAHAWADWGWSVDDRSAGDLGSVRATSPDGCRLIGRLTDDERLSLAVSSPPFPYEGLAQAGT